VPHVQIHYQSMLSRPMIIFLQLLALVDMICIPPCCQIIFCFEDVNKGGPLATTFETRNTHTFLSGLKYLDVMSSPHNGQALYPWYAHPESKPYPG